MRVKLEHNSIDTANIRIGPKLLAVTNAVALLKIRYPLLEVGGVVSGGVVVGGVDIGEK